MTSVLPPPLVPLCAPSPACSIDGNNAGYNQKQNAITPLTANVRKGEHLLKASLRETRAWQGG